VKGHDLSRADKANQINELSCMRENLPLQQSLALFGGSSSLQAAEMSQEIVAA
jgi:hypothetical protein